MRLRPYYLLLCCLFSLPGWLFSQTFLNGNFENNTSGACNYNMPNATFTSLMANTTGYGPGGELDIMSSCPYGPPQNGTWLVSLALPSGNPDAFTMQLSAPLTAGNTYTICYYDRGWDQSGCCPPGTPLQIGVSTTANAQGTVVYTSPIPSLNTWIQRTFSFTAPVNGQFISVQSSGTGRWTHVDNFSFVSCTVLPFEIQSLSGHFIDRDKVETNWEIAAGQAWSRFVPEYSYDGKIFKAGKEIQQAGREELRDFSVILTGIEQEEIYLRLRSFDPDGVESLSETVLVSRGNPENFVHLFPNPNQGVFQVEWPAAQGKLFHYQLFNLQGKQIQCGKLERGTELELREAPGHYFLLLKTNAGQTFRKQFRIME